MEVNRDIVFHSLIGISIWLLPVAGKAVIAVIESHRTTLGSGTAPLPNFLYSNLYFVSELSDTAFGSFG